MKKYHNIDALRFFFCVIIVYYHILHSNIMPFVEGNHTYLRLQELCDYASAIVQCFFIISGLFLFHSCKKEQEWYPFIWKKVFRLGPVLWFSLLLGILFFGQKLPTALLNSVFLQNIGISTVPIGITWYVSPLFWSSLFYFAIIQFCDKKRDFIIALIVYLSYVANISATSGGFGRNTVFGIVNLGLAQGLAGMGLGCLLASYLETAKRYGFPFAINNQILGSVLFTVGEIVAGLALLKIFVYGGIGGETNLFVIVVLFCGLLIDFIQKKGLISRLLDHNVFSVLGSYAYSIYIMQQTSFYILRRTLWKTAIVNKTVPCILLSLLVSIVVGIVTYYFIERPGIWIYKKAIAKSEVTT